MSESSLALPEGDRLDRYTLLKVLNEGGFGIVYLAREDGTERFVVIKEYLPGKLAWREPGGQVMARTDADPELFRQGRRAFFQEAAVLAALDHPNIVKVRHFFQAHDTVYFVMDYEQGVSLRFIIKKAERPLYEGFLRRIFGPILDGLAEVHARQLLHLDIKPSNIYIRDDGRPLLIDFGAIYNLLSGPRDPASNVVSQGFSPKEQVYAGMTIGTWTDIYALGATLRACIEGKSPPSVKKRMRRDPLIPLAELYADRYTLPFLQAVDAAMRIEPDARPQTVAEFRAMLFAQEIDENSASQGDIIRIRHA